MDIGLHVNGLRVRIGMPFEIGELRSARVSKAGFFTEFVVRRSIPEFKQAGDVMYWAKNPDLKFFRGKVRLNPVQQNRVAFANRTGRDTDSIFGTSAFLCFNNGALRLAIAQVIGSFIWAGMFTEEFREAAASVIGKATCSELTNVQALELRGYAVHRDIYLTCAWNDGHEFVISRSAPKGNYGVVYWGAAEIGERSKFPRTST